MLIGTPVDFKRFEKRSVPTIDSKGKDSLDNDYPRNEGRLANRFSPINVLWKFVWDPTSIQAPPPQKKKRKNDFFSNWIGLFEIWFRSSKMTDPRSCPTGWSYLEIYPVQRGHAQVNQQQIINCKNRYFLRVRETSQNETSPPQTSIGCFLEEKLIYLASSLIILKQARHNSWRPNFALYPAGASAKKLIALKKTYQLFTLTSTVQSSSDFIPVMVWSASTSLYIRHFPHIYREPVEHLCFRKFRTFFH